MINKKIKYQLKALINPAHWLRNYRTHKGWDEWLWDSLNNCEISDIGTYRANVNGKSVWISNYPYASGSLDDNGFFMCSRATNILLREKLDSTLPF